MAASARQSYSDELPEMIEMSAEESRAYFDREARALLGIDGDEFLRRWDAGEYDAIEDDPAHREVMYLAMLGSIVR